MKLYHIVAVSDNGVIGKNNQLPWHFSADLLRFKEITMGCTLIMGRTTFESIGKPLPGRENFVVSHRPGPEGERLRFFTSIDDALTNIKTEKAFVIGGQSLYEQTLNRIDGIYLTRVKGNYEGDAFYPGIPKGFAVKTKEKSKDDPQLEFLYYEKSLS